ncbi:toll/interleukin-1 receptor domain-containing protein [Streptomyces rubiginosohelvolus]|uniref:toll/interleukin-1 receptor domain-containing protein n=1 Tax=Streptomyces rubiginosohelvolus TaxID=67362 RepID=UPI0033B144B3
MVGVEVPGGAWFISHAGADRAWAEWAAWQLVDAGFQVELDYWDWGAGDNFVLKMNAALDRGRFLALFSPAYFEPDRFTTPEWTAIVAMREKITPVRVAEVVAQLGPDHGDTLWTAHCLARAHDDTFDHEGARALDEDTLRRRRRLLGEDHPDTLGTATNLAIRLAALGQVEEARDLGEETLARQRRVLGEDDPDTLGTASNLAIQLVALGQREEARDLAEDTLARRRRVLGEDHPGTLRTARLLELLEATWDEPDIE